MAASALRARCARLKRRWPEPTILDYVSLRFIVCTITYTIARIGDNAPVSAPGDEYAKRLSARQALFSRRSLSDVRLSQARLATFAAGAALLVGGWQGWLSWWWLAGPFVFFVWLVRRHDRVIRERDAAARAVLFYENGLARLTDRWAGTGAPGDEFADPAHPYAADLDLFGRGSLFELLSVARTRVGEATLARWLKQPADAPDIAARQAAVTELSALSDLREEVAVAGVDIAAGLHAETLTAWAEQPPLLSHGWLRPAAIALTVAAILSVAQWAATGRAALLVLVVLMQLAAFTLIRPRVHQILHRGGGWSRDLDLLATVLDSITHASFTTATLADLKARLEVAHVPPATAIRRLHRLVELHDWQHNLIFAVIAIPLLWDVHLALSMEAWRRRYGHHVRIWLDAVGEFEALSSLATYRFEHPDDPFPAIVDRADALFDGTRIGHPLLPAGRMVRNDVRLGGAEGVRLLVVSGSNMSGKSTLLRTVGVNAVLAFAGAPVRAGSLTLTPLRPGATLRIQDSLQEGRSRFYAEVTRVRELSSQANGRPHLLFLLDELFHGTNSHDRVVGAAGVLRSLIDRGAIGLVTTHDLALSAVAAELAPRAANVHFEDRFEAGELVFDYTMKPGPVTRSNALALMRAVGLEVSEGVGENGSTGGTEQRSTHGD